MLEDEVQVQRRRERLQEARTLRGLSHRELSERAGLGETASQKIERGSREGKRQTFEALAKALAVSIDWLWDGEGPMLPQSLHEPLAPEPADVFTTGERRFREWVSEREPQHAEKVPEFLRLLAERRFERWSAKVSALDIEEDLIKEFRAWRRGEWDEEPEGIPYVPAKRGSR